MRIIPLVLAVALFMENMDSTVIATSLPAIAADIGAEPISLKLALTAYFVALAIFIPLSGWMADRFGAKNIFRVAIVVFMIGSICCAFSDSLLTFVLSRFLQGVGGSILHPFGRGDASGAGRGQRGGDDGRVHVFHEQRDGEDQRREA